MLTHGRKEWLVWPRLDAEFLGILGALVGCRVPGNPGGFVGAAGPGLGHGAGPFCGDAGPVGHRTCQRLKAITLGALSVSGQVTSPAATSCPTSGGFNEP